MKHTLLTFENATEAWEGINEYLANNQNLIKKRGGELYGQMMVSHDNIIIIEDCRLDPKFNFGKVLGYTSKKWSKLINNYVNFNYLDLVKNEVLERELKRSKAYNYTYHFDNVHGSGKDCLISLTFTRRKTHDTPILFFHTRASEITKRSAFDFLLVQRMAEYVYGKGVKVRLVWDIPYMFINLECFLMYVSWKTESCLKKDGKEWSKFQEKVFEKLQKFREVPLESIKYKVSQRAARQVKAWNGTYEPLPDLFAKSLKLNEDSKRKINHINKLNEAL